VRDGSDFEAMLAEAASWADRITLCVTASRRESASLPWWGELLARSAKCDRIYLRHAEHAERWLLERLHETGALRLLESSAKQVASNLLTFSRAGEIRVLLSHLPLERAVAGAAFGTLLSFRGGHTGELARACRAQLESWERLAHIPTGSDIDALDRHTLGALTQPSWPDRVERDIVSDPSELDACVRGLMGALRSDSAWSVDAAALDTTSTESLATSLAGGWAVHVQAFSGGRRLLFQHRDRTQAPFVLTLHAGADWAAGNALILRSGERRVLVWRGGLLGHSRSRGELLWSAARLQTLLIEDRPLELAERVAVVAREGALPSLELGALVSEIARLGELFGVEPPPALGQALADFTSLSARQQTPLLWRALIGLGPLEPDVATLLAARTLRDQGYLHAASLEPASAALALIAERLASAASLGWSFDRPEPGQIRAIAPDRAAYLKDDWLECLVQALPEDQVLTRGTALRLLLEHARQQRGLTARALSEDAGMQQTLETTLACALGRGLLARVGAGGVQRVAPLTPRPELAPAWRASGDESEAGFLTGWRHALGRLSAVQRLILTRRTGYYAAPEHAASVAQRLGLTLERTRQIEAEAWLRLANDSSWVHASRARLSRAFAGGDVLPVSLLVSDDAWWRGIEQHLDLAAALFEVGLGATFHRVQLGGPGRGPELFARFSQAALDVALERLLERAARIATPCSIEDYLPEVAATAAELGPTSSEYVREALEARLELDPEDPTRVLAFSAHSRPGAEPSRLDAAGSEASLRLEDAIRSAFRGARTPLALAAVAERVRQRMDAEEADVLALLSRAPFVRRNADQYGLIARDVPGGHEAIAAALNGLVDTLEAQKRALCVEDAVSVASAELKQAWSAELVCSLIDSDPALCRTAAQVGLSRWRHAGSLPAPELLCPDLPAGARSAFTELTARALGKPEALVRSVRAELRRLEAAIDADDHLTSSLARQLCELYERLLEHVASRSAASQQLAHATILHFLAAAAGDEDDMDAPAAARTELLETRAVLAAVLSKLELDWL
jgi:hypothetical protein